jgi:Protein of unknown function (DUF3455)
MTCQSVFLGLWVGLLSGPFLAGQTAQNPLLNSDSKEPQGTQVLFRLTTLPTSVQIYTCRQASQGLAWVSDPDAIMTNSEKTLLVHHYRGPVWEAVDGSFVRGDGPKAQHYLPKNPDAIHWLELPAKTTAGQFAKVAFIRRVDTTGGLLPADKPCDSQHAGDQERVGYNATYLFYGTK